MKNGVLELCLFRWGILHAGSTISSVSRIKDILCH